MQKKYFNDANDLESPFQSAPSYDLFIYMTGVLHRPGSA